jgi:hypothetical protein
VVPLTWGVNLRLKRPNFKEEKNMSSNSTGTLLKSVLYYKVFDSVISSGAS